MLAAILALTALFGCRAFEPEVVIVNNAPETYIIGAPGEEAGGYFHFHIYWYGTDADGRVERFVWALTDSTIQDEETLEDEEDSRFNPAENILTLDIGNWTTKTDSVFDFRIDSGSITSIDKTFHIVAVDDRGDYDRTPARLYFLTNALGNPTISFYSSADHTPENAFAQLDTIGFGRGFTLSWEGTTPNKRSFTAAHLDRADTVGIKDGLNGYKFKLPSDVDCDDSNEDCWNPRRFDDAVNDSVSFFSELIALDFNNGADGALGGNVYRRRLASGVHTLLVNTVDVAGVEVPSARRALDYVINYDPDTRLLRSETDPFNPDDTQVYPYYEVFYPDGVIERTGMAEGDTVPNRAKVVFKAIGWDDSRDVRTGEQDYAVLFKGQFVGVGAYKGNPLNPFTLRTQYSWSSPDDREDSGNPINFDWLSQEGGADTLSFLVGPFEYEFNMVSVDEHGRVDGTPDFFHFYANFPPCVQAVEVVPSGTASSFPFDGPCEDPVSQAQVDTLYCSFAQYDIPGHPEWIWMGNFVATGDIAYNPRSGAFYPEVPPVLTQDIQIQNAFQYEYELLLHGKEDPQETAFIPTIPLNSRNRPENRMMSWQYEVRSEADAVSNIVNDGGGIDDIDEVTYNYSRELLDPEQRIVVDDQGVWHLRIRVYVPFSLVQFGIDGYRGILETNEYLTTNGYVDDAIDLTTKQLGVTTAQVKARDSSNCIFRPDRGNYIYYQHVRVPGFHGESCTTEYDDELGRLSYDLFPFTSEIFAKNYVIKVVTRNTDGTYSIYPPNPE